MTFSLKAFLKKKEVGHITGDWDACASFIERFIRGDPKVILAQFKGGNNKYVAGECVITCSKASPDKET